MQQFPLSQGAFGASPFHQERYPLITEQPKESPSFMQKISGWFFSKNSDKAPQQSFGPPPAFAVPSTYGPPQPQSSHGPPIRLQQYQRQNQHQNQNNKNCNPCNYVPWIPLQRHQGSQGKNPSPQIQYNNNVPSPSVNDYNALKSNGPSHGTLLPSKLSLPAKETHINNYLQPPSASGFVSSQNKHKETPFSLSQIDLNHDNPTPLTNSYGTPIAPNAYSSPYSETNDNVGHQIGHGQRQLGNNLQNNFQHGYDQNRGKYSNGDSFISKPTENVPQRLKPNKEHNVSSPPGNAISSPDALSLEHNDDPFAYPVFRVNKVLYNQNGGQILQPIPFPNLSPVPVLPIFNARPFRKKNQVNIGNHPSSTIRSIPLQSSQSHTPTKSYTPSYDSNNKYPSTGNFELVPSIPVAEFTSLVQYPISIVQSPLLDIDISKNQAQEQDHKEESSQDSFDFNSDPIVVENQNTKNTYDSYSAASGGSDHDVEQTTRYEVHNNKYTTTESYPKAGIQFLPTPNSVDTVSNDYEKTRKPSLSYAYIDQTFYTTTPKPVSYRPAFTRFEGTPEPNPFRTADPQTLQSLDSPLLYLQPNTPHKNSEPFKNNLDDDLSQTPEKNINHISSSNNYISTSTQRPISSTINPWNNAYRYVDNNNNGFVPGKWPPPIDSKGQGITNPTKKPKRIQIIIPYTSQNQPSPFKFSSNNVASSSGWVPMTDDIVNSGRKVPPSQLSGFNGHSTNSLVDYHESSESKIVSSSTPSLNLTTTNYSDSRTTYPSTVPEILTTYQTVPNTESKTTFDIKKLQKNIDDWTAQEFSKIYRRQQKASTISHLKRSKKIPDEYFTTIPPQRKTSKSFLSTINDLNASFLDNEAAGSIQHSVETDLHNEKFIENFNNDLYEHNTIPFTQTTYYTTTPLPTTTPYVETTTTPPKTTTRHSWDKIQTSISPLTKEKVYVVTPQPRSFGSTNNDRHNISASSTSPPFSPPLRDGLSTLTFKSPRFLVRPTPGPTGSQKEHVTTVRSEKQSNIPISGFDWLRSSKSYVYSFCD